MALASLAAGLLAAPGSASAASPVQDPFYLYTGGTPLAQVAPGTVLKTRTSSLHVLGVPLPVRSVQLLYRSTGLLGEPTVNVTTVLRPPLLFDAGKALSYQSFYDSLNPADEPSRALGGATSTGGLVNDAEVGFFVPFLLQGISVIVCDTEGQAADFAAGPEYGRNTLDSIRAAVHSPATGLRSNARVGLLGYSGGAIATSWASALAPSYAPDVNRQLVGAAEGGVLVDPAHNLHYIDGSRVWAGVMPMAIVGVARSFDVDLTPYLSPYGVQVFNQLRDASITQVLGFYPGLTWQQLAKPQYAQPEDIPIFVQLVNQLNLGSAGAPTVPMFIGQGANGVLEGTAGSKPGIGAGDGVMIAGDVRSLARQYCAAGTSVRYEQYDLTSHFLSVATWAPAAIGWLESRFAEVAPQSNCAQIAPGNSLAPIP